MGEQEKSKDGEKNVMEQSNVGKSAKSSDVPGAESKAERGQSLRRSTDSLLPSQLGSGLAKSGIPRGSHIIVKVNMSISGHTGHMRSPKWHATTAKVSVSFVKPRTIRQLEL